MNAVEVDWIKCGEDKHWCDFFNLDLSNNLHDVSGVYIIFYLGNRLEEGRVVRVGQGDIADRLKKHRQDPDILKYKNKNLKVTWAPVHGAQQDGVEKYLADTWNPLVGERFPDRAQIKVNSPFE